MFYDGHCAIIRFEFNVFILILDYSMDYFMAIILNAILLT